EQMNGAGVGTCRFQRLSAVVRLYHGVACCLQYAAGGFTHGSVVFHQQDRLANALCPSLPGPRLLAGAFGFWQAYDKPAAIAKPAMDLDRPLILLNDRVYGPQPKPISLPGFLSGKERLKQTRQCFAAHAATVIGYL